MKPRLLDLFCCAGGAGMGYYRAGFEVVGVDIAPQPHYPFEFHQADALEYLAAHGHEFDAIHASPPCQAYTSAQFHHRNNHPKLIDPTRSGAIATGKPYIIENVPGAPLINPTLLCGAMFGLGTYRHRLFEANFDLGFLMHPGHGATQDKLCGPTCERRGVMAVVVGKSNFAGAAARNKIAMGIDWMNEAEIAQAIPPAYTEFIGRQLMTVLEAANATR